MTHSSQHSKSSSLDRKLTREINIKEIKEDEFEQTDKDDSEHEINLQSQRQPAYYIDDGRNQSVPSDDYPVKIEDFLTSTQKLDLSKKSQNFVDSGYDSRVVYTDEIEPRKSRKHLFENPQGKMFITDPHDASLKQTSKFQKPDSVSKDLFNSRDLPLIKVSEFTKQKFSNFNGDSSEEEEERVTSEKQNKDNSIYERFVEDNEGDQAESPRQGTREDRPVRFTRKHSDDHEELEEERSGRLQVRELKGNAPDHFHGAEEAISVIQEVDESNFTTDEKFRKCSPTWGKNKHTSKTDNLEKIPFSLDEEILRIDSGSKRHKKSQLVDMETQTIKIVEEPIEESIQTSEIDEGLDESLQTEPVHLSNRSQELQTTFEPDVRSQGFQTNNDVAVSCQDVQTENELSEKHMQTDNLGRDKFNQTEYSSSKEEKVHLYDAHTQVDTAYVEVKDRGFQTYPEQKVEKRDISQFVCFRPHLVSQNTQTPAEPHKKTRTGGVQV